MQINISSLEIDRLSENDVKDLLPAMNGEVKQVQPFETLKLNPPRHECPFCNEIFEDQDAYMSHLQHYHGAKA